MKKKPKKPAGSTFLTPMAKLTGSEVAVRIARPPLRAGAEIGLGVLTNTAKISAWKYRWIIGPAAALLGIAGEVFIDDGQMGRLIKAPFEGMSSWGIKDGLASALPDLKAKMGLAGLGAARATETNGEENEWSRIADQIAAEEGEEQTARPVAGVDEGSRGDNAWMETVDYQDVDDVLEGVNSKLCAA